MARSGSRHRVALLTSHPTQYLAPLLAEITRSADIDLHAWYFSDFSTRGYEDPEFASEIAWDVDVTGGHEARFLATDAGPGTRWAPIAPRAEQRLSSEHYDALWLHGWNHPLHWRAWRLARRRGWKVFLRGETPAFAQGEIGEVGLVRRFVRSRLTRADAALAIGRANARWWRSIGMPAERIHAMPYGVDHARFAREAKAARFHRGVIRERLGLPLDGAVILVVGKLIPRKRPLDVLRAFEGLPEALRRRTSLAFVGEGELRQEIERERLASCDATRIHLAGFRNQGELPVWYAAADVLVLASDHEPWGLVLNEAMASGLAVVASEAVGAAEDLVLPGQTGDRFPTGDVRALERCLTPLLASPDLLEASGRAAAEHVRSCDFEHAVAGLRMALEGSSR